jgi:hypothetical protein
MKTTVDVFNSYCFNPCWAGSIVTAIFSDAAIPEEAPADYFADETSADLLCACALGARIQQV